MKKFLLMSLVFFCSCSATKDNFRKGASLVESESFNKIIKPQEILFEFKADTPHLIYHYLDLSKNLKKRFEKHNINVFFNYDMNITNKSLKEDIETVPKRKIDASKFKTIVKIEAKFPENKKFKPTPINRPNKTFHQISYQVFQYSIKSYRGLVDIMAYNTIVTQNEKVSKIIEKSILEK